jgi:hypothetical protein
MENLESSMDITELNKSEYDYADILLYSIHAILAHYGVKEYIND